MKIPNEAKIVTSFVLVLVIFLALFYLGDDLGLPSDIDLDFMMVIPGIFLFAVGMYLLASIGGTFILPALILIGVGFSILIGTLHTMGYITTQMLTGLTIGQLQLWIIIIAAIFGAIASAYDYVG